MVMDAVNAISAYQNAGAKGAGGQKGLVKADEEMETFSDVLGTFVGDAVESVKKGEEMAAKGAVGKADMQDVILAVSEAEVMMTAMTTIRDKVITAYQEVIRTAI